MKKIATTKYDFCGVEHFAALKRRDAIIRGVTYLEEIRYLPSEIVDRWQTRL